MDPELKNPIPKSCILYNAVFIYCFTNDKILEIKERLVIIKGEERGEGNVDVGMRAQWKAFLGGWTCSVS